MVLLPDVPVIVLQLPIIVTIIAFTRYFVGFKTWKNYPTIALTLSFFLLHQTTNHLGLTFVYWLLAILVIIGSALATRYASRKLKVNYYARIASMYLVSTVALLLLLAVAVKLSFSALLTGQAAIALFLVGTAIDELATLLFKKDAQEFLRRSITTLGLSLFSGLIITWKAWNTLLGNHHEILVIVLLVDIIVAFWTAFRLTELVRFGSIIKNRK